MKKYNNIAGLVNFSIIFINIIGITLLLSVYFLSKGIPLYKWGKFKKNSRIEENFTLFR